MLLLDIILFGELTKESKESTKMLFAKEGGKEGMYRFGQQFIRKIYRHKTGEFGG